MKTLKSVRQHNGDTERGKTGKRSEKYTKLDRKSSRGMIYENEELRLRTININAEVERGQTDIKRLRKENEQLRREIWTLRDECDRLNKRVKAKFIEHEQGLYGARYSGANGCACQCNEACEGCEACIIEDSDSCDSCCCHEEEISPCNEECCNDSKHLTDNCEGEQSTSTKAHNEQLLAETKENPSSSANKLKSFDHLSVVSEETLSNSEVVLAQQSENILGYTPDLSGSQTTLPSLVGPLTPLTPVELVANELNDLQAVLPPLSYFENILQQHMTSNNGSNADHSHPNSRKAMSNQTNGWDYKLESPFSQTQYPVANSISPILTKRIPAQTLTTFVPTATMTPPSSLDTATATAKPTLPQKPADLDANNQQNPIIETVPITVLPPNGCGSSSGNTTPKNFFAPMKPKLKLNTALANQKRFPPPLPPVTVSVNQVQSLLAQQKCEPPDLYVTNGLASPYRPMNKIQPPPVPQRSTSTSSTTTQAQVSSTQHQRNKQQQSHHRRQHHMRRYQQQLQHQQHHQIYDVAAANSDVNVMSAAASFTATTTKPITTVTVLNCTKNLCTSMKTSSKNVCPPLTTLTTAATLTATVLTSNTLCNSLNPLLTTTTSPCPLSLPPTTTLSSAATSFSMAYLTTTTTTATTSPSACFKFINANFNFRESNDPVYAIAQNVCHNLITASAVTQPLMSSIVKCCIAKQQQLQLQEHQHIPAASSLSTIISFHTTNAVIASNNVGSNCDVRAQPSSSTTSTTTTTSSSASSPLLSSSSLSSSLAAVAKLSNVSCSLTINSFLKTSITTTTTSMNLIVVDSMCQTDSANLESILNDIEAISEDILAIQLVKTKSRDNIHSRSTQIIGKTEKSAFQVDGRNAKPYRSEMNLLLTYEGDNTTIKHVNTTANTDNKLIPESASNTNTLRRTKSLERDHADSPSPRIPDPMQPFPENRKYIGLEGINKAATTTTTIVTTVAATATQTSPIANSPSGQRTQLPFSPLATNVNASKSLNAKQLPPTPPTRTYPAPLHIKCAGVARSSSVTNCLPTTDSGMNSPILASVTPNKSQLYAALANAAAKRAQFRSQPTHMTRSLDIDCGVEDDTSTAAKKMVKSGKEALVESKRKGRRVSIVCSDSESPQSPERTLSPLRNSINHEQPSTSGSCTDLHATIPNPSLRNLKQASQSTPNSPHFSRKHENSPLATAPVLPTISITANSTSQQQRKSSNTSGKSQLLAHNHAYSNSYPNVISPLAQQQKVRKNSQDAIKASAAEMACAAANVMRSKCSRRHSDSNVSHANQRISGASGGTNSTHHHHLHNHHHRQHSSSLASNTNPHQSHHSRRDSTHETAASFSDRNSNSLTSSRESSASFSMRSQRRKLSISSHTGGKIPWCGCWGNGCL